MDFADQERKAAYIGSPQDPKKQQRKSMVGGLQCLRSSNDQRYSGQAKPLTIMCSDEMA
jgi:hypothetical protein